MQRKKEYIYIYIKIYGREAWQMSWAWKDGIEHLLLQAWLLLVKSICGKKTRHSFFIPNNVLISILSHYLRSDKGERGAVTIWFALFFFLFFHEEGGIRVRDLPGVQPCALPIFLLIFKFPPPPPLITPLISSFHQKPPQKKK